ncbi:MAG: patatin-like phospholipase family protein, partial [Campylobacterota bacterium]|nr:patatin-like phospholipase family protein [Campylobacterota bacterium]
MANNQFPREISLCLSGGAAKGAFHLGVVNVLQEHGIKIKAISGTSIGALIGASLASGKKPQEILEILKSKEFKKSFKFSLGKGYLYSVDMKNPVISQLTDKLTFEDLDTPLEIAITNTQTAEAEYCNSGDKLIESIIASCAISPIIEPQKIDGVLYVDGGITDNFPVERLKKYPYKILGVNLYPHTQKAPNSLLGWIKKIVFIAWQSP